MFILYSQNVYPLGFTAHPKEPNQFAIALSDGTVKVLEPTESAGSWGNMPPVKWCDSFALL